MDYPEIEFKWEWLAADDAKAPELRATWARLEMYVGTSCLTLVEDVESSSSRRSVFVPLYPLAEWIAFNWWSLIADARPAALMSKPGRRGNSLFEPATKKHRERHGLRNAGDGFLWPNLLVLPQGQTTYLSWRADVDINPNHPIKYLTSGDSTADAQHVQRALRHLVEAVITRLHERDVIGTTLETEWLSVQGADEAEAAYCVAAARLGLDPYSDAAEYEPQILSAARALEEGVLGDFLDAVEPSQIVETLAWVTSTVDQIKELPTTTSRLLPLKLEIDRLARTGDSPPHSLPWEAGWRQARIVRQAMAVDDRSPVQVEDLVTSVVRAAPTRSLQAVGTPTGGATDPPIAVGQTLRSSTRRFTLARALWHLLWDAPGTFLVTSAYTDRQKVERAFAAELLAPASGIATMINDDSLTNLDEDLVERIASSYKVSAMLIEHQIENQVLPAFQ